MSEERELLKKAVPHLKVLSLQADIDTLYEVKALVVYIEACLAKPEQEHVGYVYEDNNNFTDGAMFSEDDPLPRRIKGFFEPVNIRKVYAETFKANALVINDGVRFDDYPVGTKFYVSPPQNIKPIAQGEIIEAWKSRIENLSDDEKADSNVVEFIRGVRYAEKVLGII